MIWAKIRNNNEDWAVYHKDLNGGTNPEQYRLTLNNLTAEVSSSTAWASKAPTSTHFFIGNDADTNGTNDQYIYMLFASVAGISKVGSYSGQGFGQSQTITTGFQPRFILAKSTSVSSWYMYDTTRGWGSGEDKRLELNQAQPQAQTQDVGAPTSTGFTVNGGRSISQSGQTFIYYAHS